jgi:hypothetical protein
MVVLFDLYHLPDDIFSIVFATDQQIQVAKLLVDEIKRNGGDLGKTEMSLFANKLHDGTMVEIEEVEGPIRRKKKIQMSYNKRQFYDRILTPMKGMGLIDYDMYKKKYLLTDRFNKVLVKVGLMWIQEMNKKV